MPKMKCLPSLLLLFILFVDLFNPFWNGTHFYNKLCLCLKTDCCMHQKSANVSLQQQIFHKQIGLRSLKPQQHRLWSLFHECNQTTLVIKIELMFFCLHSNMCRSCYSNTLTRQSRARSICLLVWAVRSRISTQFVVAHRNSVRDCKRICMCACVVTRRFSQSSSNVPL